MAWQYTEFRRDELYEQVWSRPLTKVAKDYDISDVGLRKICVKLDVPLPAAGHWTKVAAGYAIKRPALRASTGPAAYTRSRYVSSADKILVDRCNAYVEADLPSRPATPNPPLRASLDECLPLTKRIAKKLYGKSKDSRGWHLSDGDGLMWISVSPEHSLKAVLLLNALLEATLAADYQIVSKPNEPGRAYVIILQKNFSFKVRERSRRELLPLTAEQTKENKRLGFNWNTQQYEYHPTGEFDISATRPDDGYELARISDTVATRAENKIATFIGRLRELALREKAQSEVNAERQKIAEAKAAERYRLEEIKRNALKQLKDAEEWASQLDRASKLRALAKEFDAGKLRSSDGSIDAEWLHRAADWLDPTVKCHWEEVDGPNEKPD
ncbi:hypothetical protein [Robbsia andropogonis]|uniref:hypothetical protein n=1 Tax=Robbsia andropogonis TaxID=28092 RepID=UPI0004AFC968|nr:hypothetical protein [Robbsia andropogonis]